MDLDAIFLVANYGVVPAWALLAFAPGWSGTQRVVHGIAIPLLLGLLYGGLLVTSPPTPEGGGFSTLDAVATLFTSRHAVLTGWVHYLVFDLFVGAWEVRDARRRGIGHGWVLPCLGFTMMLGPLGLLGYLVMRWVRTRATGLDERAAVPAAA